MRKFDAHSWHITTHTQAISQVNHIAVARPKITSVDTAVTSSQNYLIFTTETMRTKSRYSERRLIEHVMCFLCLTNWLQRKIVRNML